jgi:steroid 5-alpha reductase family enzyme
VILLFAGIGIRWISIATLGKLFTGRVLIQRGHHLVRVGIYARVRHPAYSGSLLAHLGVGLAFMNWWTLICSPPVRHRGALSHPHRRTRPRRYLHRPEYAEYAHETKRLVRWVR